MGFYSNGPPAYTVGIYEDMGKAVAISMLDLAQKNPHSRVKNSEYGSSEGLRTAAQFDLARRAPFKYDGKLK